ncbi:MAG: hypothetical protein IT431_00385 [Phycisphaerales bacterium]|nr:hypothetical protein [Phycisphaerales bacterium]
MATSQHNSRAVFWAVWSVVAAFGTYFCMYGFRKPFNAATFEGAEYWGVAFKGLLVTSQLLGYMLSKFIGIKVISEMPPHRRAGAILVLIGVAQAALVLFAITPRPWNAAFLFVNGMPLGMVFGLVLGFLEGRRLTEALTAGLCASFILAGGVTKTVGAKLLGAGVPEDWMPAAAGCLYLLPLVLGVWMLRRIPAPDARDIERRHEREVMSGADRLALVKRHAVGLIPLVLMYMILTVVRSLRDDFGVEIWRDLGYAAKPMSYSASEFWVMLGVTVVTGLPFLIAGNGRAFFTSLATCAAGFACIAGALVLLSAGLISPFPFMVLTGLGLYLPYVAIHTTVFERLLAWTRDKGNLGFLMYLADASGYLGYVALLIVKSLKLIDTQADMSAFFRAVCWLAVFGGGACVAVAWLYFATNRRYKDAGRPHTAPASFQPAPAVAPASPDPTP